MKRAHPGADEVNNSSVSCDSFSAILEEAVNHFTVDNFTEAADAMIIPDDFIERGRKAAALRSGRRGAADHDYSILENWWMKIPGSTTIRGRVTRALFLRIMSILLDEWLNNSTLGLFAGAQKWLLSINYEALTDFQSASEGNELENTICALLLDAACAVIRLLHPSTPKILRPAGSLDSKRPRFEEKSASVTHQGNYIIKALRLDGVPISNKNRALKILLNLLRGNVFDNVSIRPGFGNCINEVSSYCLERCFNSPDELASDLYVLASWRNSSSTKIDSVISGHFDRILEVIEKFLVHEEIGADEFLPSIDGALQLLASLYAFGCDSGGGGSGGGGGGGGGGVDGGSSNVRVLSLDVEMHFNILSKLSTIARDQKSLYGIIFRHFTQLSRKLVPSQFLPLTQCIARIIQRLCIDGQDASTLYNILIHEDNFELFGSMIRSLPSSLWHHIMPRRPGVLSPSMSGFNQHRLTLADRLLHRLASVLSRCADVITSDNGRDFTSALLMKRVEDDETLLAAVLILLKSMRHLHQIITTCATETFETSIIAVNWWLYNGLNADLAHDGLMLQRSGAGRSNSAGGGGGGASGIGGDTLLSQSLNEMTARNLQRLTRMFAASEGKVLTELIKTSLSLLDPSKETNVDSAYLDAFACVVKLWAERVATVKTTWQFGHNVRKSLAACQEKLRHVAAGVPALTDDILIGKIEDRRDSISNDLGAAGGAGALVLNRFPDHQNQSDSNNNHPPRPLEFNPNYQPAAASAAAAAAAGEPPSEDDQDMAEASEAAADTANLSKPYAGESRFEFDHIEAENGDERPFEVYNNGEGPNSGENSLAWG